LSQLAIDANGARWGGWRRGSVGDL